MFLMPDSSIQIFHPLNLRKYRILFSAFVLLILMSSTGLNAKTSPGITSVTHKMYENGDSFKITADGPFTKPSVVSGSSDIMFEFRGMNVKVESGKGHSYSEAFDGTLADGVDVGSSGNPPLATVKVKLAGDVDYSYHYVRHSSEDIEIFILKPSSVEPDHFRITSDVQREAEAPAAIKHIEKDIQVPSGFKQTTGMIAKVKYFPVDKNTDRIEFLSNGPLAAPDLKIRAFPLRLDVVFDGIPVKLPGNIGAAPFLTSVPGFNIDKLKAWNNNGDGAGAEFEIFMAAGSTPDWHISSPSPDRIWIDISKQGATPSASASASQAPKDSRNQPTVVAEPKLVGESPFTLESEPEGDQATSGIREYKVHKVNGMEFSLKWPDESDQLIEKLKQVTNGLGPGVMVEVPVMLRLYIGVNPYNSRYPLIER
jgi:hypothetical protein